ncbi:unnamed protein product [Lota lota]
MENETIASPPKLVWLLGRGNVVGWHRRYFSSIKEMPRLPSNLVAMGTPRHVTYRGDVCGRKHATNGCGVQLRFGQVEVQREKESGSSVVALASREVPRLSPNCPHQCP